MNDIYIELKDIAEKNNITISIDEDTDDEKKQQKKNGRRKSSIYEMLPDFKNQIIIVQTRMKQIRLNVDEINNLREESNKFVAPTKEKELSKKLTKILKDNEKLVENVKEIMNKLTSDVELSKKELPEEPETKAKITHLHSIQTELIDLIKISQKAQTDFKSNIKDKIGRQIEILDDQIGKEEKSKLCNDPEGFQKLIAKKTLGSVPLELKYTVDDILDKYDDIKKLERSVNYVYQMFSDIAMLVHNQSEDMDNIETNLNSAKNYMERAVTNLVKMKEEHQKTRKRMCCVLIIALVLLAVIATPITLKLTNQL